MDPALKMLKVLFDIAAAISLYLVASIEDMENNITKKHSSKFIRSLNVVIHAGDPAGGSSGLRFAIMLHPLLPLHHLHLFCPSEEGMTSVFLR